MKPRKPSVYAGFQRFWYYSHSFAKQHYNFQSEYKRRFSAVKESYCTVSNHYFKCGINCGIKQVVSIVYILIKLFYSQDYNIKSVKSQIIVYNNTCLKSEPPLNRGDSMILVMIYTASTLFILLEYFLEN